MEGRPAISQSDSLLLPFLRAVDEAESQCLLSELVSEHAQPIIRPIVRRKLGVFLEGSRDTDRQDLEDLCSEITLKLVARLRDSKAHPNRNAIASFPNYVAVMAYHFCDQYLRHKYPERSRLKNRLRYLLNHHPEFALWEDADYEWLCGFSQWRDRKEKATPASNVERLVDDLIASGQLGSFSKRSRTLPSSELVFAVFLATEGPIELDRLVDVVAQLCDIKDHAVQRIEEDADNLPDRLVDSRVRVDTALEQRLYLERLWSEICILPVKQRAALLLNLKDPQGNGLIALFPLTGVATVRQLADAIAMSAEQFAELWDALPLGDAAIAEHLGITRQQVINLRKSARERLARRTKGF